MRQLISRNLESLEEFQRVYQLPQITTRLAEMDEEVDAVIVTVSDHAIAQVAQQLPLRAYTLIHCSGNTPLSSLSQAGHSSTAVLYPLQSFTKGVLADFQQIPLFLETHADCNFPLEELAKALSTQVYQLTSEQRKTLHVGAVWANNFTNLLYRYAEQLLADRTDLDFSVYQPLLQGHIQKLKELSPSHLQTGPAVRGDLSTITDHLKQLQDYPDLEALYLLLSKRINPELPDLVL